MSEDGKLVVADYMTRHGWRIVWYFDEEGDYGAVVGDDPKIKSDVELKELFDRDDEDWEYYFINSIADKLSPKKDSYGFYWESKTAANKALKEIKARLKAAKSDKLWPEWAVTALANGWKAPKGWEP